MTPRPLKLFLTVLAGSMLLALPQNIIGCGPTEDPWDYFTSFFSNQLEQPASHRPFYYTALLQFYDDADYNPAETNNNDAIIAEWKANTSPGLPDSSMAELVYGFTAAEVEKLINHITKNAPATLPKKLAVNGMAQHLVSTKNTEALSYLLLAKNIEPYCTTPDDWTAPRKADSIKLNSYIVSADSRYKEAKTSFMAAKYAFLRCKLAFYNKRNKDCIAWYAEAFSKPALATAAVEPLSLSYMAGSQFRSGNGKAAAYAFSKAFAQTTTNKKQQFLGFYWATDGCNPKLLNNYLTACTNNAEKANMTALFALYGTNFQLPAIKAVHALDADCPLLSLLVLREINKLEEQYLTPKLRSQKGSKAYYTSWWDAKDHPERAVQIAETLDFFEQLFKQTKPTQKAVYGAAAAYTAFLQSNYDKANALIAAARQSQPSPATANQLKLLALLVAANSPKTLDANAENNLLPQLQWLKQQAQNDVEYLVFYRNFFSEIMAAKYAQQGNTTKMVMCYAAADAVLRPDTITYRYFGYDMNAIDYLHNSMSTADVTSLYTYLAQANKSAYDKFLQTATPITTNAVTDMLGTTYLRDFNFEQAITWLKKSDANTPLTTDYYNSKTDKTVTVNVNPFHDYLNDVQRYEKPVAKPYTKLSFAQKMLELETTLSQTTNADAKAKLYYQLASAYYNISFYGNSHMAVDFYRHSSFWNTGTYALDWEKEYYGVVKSSAYYKKAYELSPNKEFKAAACFLYLKCMQRQLPRPEYDSKMTYQQYENSLKAFQKRFKNNPLFSNFTKEFGTTQFYKYTYNRCSYLRDFVGKK